MIDGAVILARELLGGAGAFPERILGHTYLKRALLTARQGGVRKFLVLHGVESSDGVALLLRDEQLKGAGIDLFPSSLGAGFPLPDAFIQGEGGLLVIAEGAIFDPGVIGDAPEQFPSPGVRVYLPGLALCRGERLTELTADLKEGRLLEGLQEGADRSGGEDETKSLPSSRRFATRVRDMEGHRRAEKLLLKSVRKETDGFVARHLNRPLSLHLSRHFIRLGLTPNQISVGNLAIGLAGAWITALGGYANIAVGALLFHLGSVLDGSDGEVAKLTHSCSEKGPWIDTLCDEIACFAYFVALPLGLYRSHGELTYLLLGMVTMASGAILYGLMIRYVRNSGGGGSMVQIIADFQESSRLPGAFGRINGAVSAFSFVFRRDFFAFAIFLLCVLGKAPVIVWILGILTPVSVLYMAWFSSRRLGSRGERVG